MAMRDFTGGVLETYNLKKLDDHPNLHETLKGALEKGALVGSVFLRHQLSWFWISTQITMSLTQ